MIRFMSDTRYAGLEKEMQHIPGFRPRRSGMVISHLSGCLENQRSPCERRVTDCRPVGQFFMLECTGIKDGKYIITDLNGDGEISDDDRTYTATDRRELP